MKQSLLFATLFLFTASLWAQPALNSESFYAPGESVTAYEVNPNGLQDGPDGTDQLWDFSHLESTGLSPLFGGTVVDPQTLSDFEFYTDANIAMVLPNGTTRYWKNDENGLSAIGMGGNNDLLTLVSPNAWLTYPFSYGSTVSGQSDGTLYGACRSYQWSSSSETNGVGYGTLVLPSGTYENVLKVRRISFVTKANDEIGLERENNIIEHFWFKPGLHGPLLYTRSWNNNGCPGSNSGAEAFYTVPSTLTSNITVASGEEIEMSMFPNPAREKVQLSIRGDLQGETHIWISDIVGHQVKSIKTAGEDFRNSLLEIDVSHLHTGVYFVNVENGSTKFARKLVVR